MVSIFAFAVTIGLHQFFVFSAFQARDIERARDLLGGTLIWHGPEASNDFNLPGPFFYYLLALPGLVVKTWKAQWYLLLVMFALSEGILWAFLRRNFGVIASTSALYLTLTNQRWLYALANFWNPSYLPLFTVLILFAAFRCFSAPKKLLPTLAFFLLIGLASQIHFVVLTYVAAFFVTLFVAQIRGLPRPSWKHVGLGCALWLATWLPFYWFEKGGLLVAERFSEYQGVRGSLQVLNLAGSIVPNLQLMAQSLLLSPNSTLAVLILATAAGSILWIRSRGWAELPPAFRQFALLISVFVAVTTVPAFSVRFISDIPLQVRHLVPLTFFVIVAVSFWFQVLCGKYPKFIYVFFAAVGIEAFQRQPPRAIALILLIGVLFWLTRMFKSQVLQWGVRSLILAGVIVVGVHRLSGQSPKQEDNLASMWDVEFACQKIYAMTGWKFDEARFKTYFLNLHITSLPKPMYDDTAAAGRRDDVGDGEIHGFFVAFRGASEPAILDQTSFIKWLAGKEIESSLRLALQRGDLIVLPPFPERNAITLIPYKVNPRSTLPQAIHNSGVAYGYQPLLSQIGDQKLEFTGRWQGCTDKDPACYLDMAVGVDSSQRPRQTKLYLHGPLTSRPKYTAMFRALGLKGLYAKIHCGRDEFKFELADSVGYRRESGERAMNNNFLLTPVHWDLPTPCSGKIDNVEVGWRKSYEVQATKFISSPGERFSFEDRKTR